MNPRFFLLRRILFYGTALVVGGLALLVVALRWWILPDIGQYRADIEAQLSKTVGQTVTIGKLEASWAALRPHLNIQNMVVHDRTGTPAISLEQVAATLSWRTLLVFELRLHRLEIHRPSLAITREPDGLIYISGIAINDPKTPPGFADWILRQEAIRVHHATVSWQDKQREAPILVLNDVGLHLESSFNRHHFGVLASPPKALASTLDVRGDLRGKTFQRLDDWSGELYANLGYTDIGAWQKWFDLPYRIRAGQGGLRLWSGIKAGRIDSITAQVQLQGVKARLVEHLPELDLPRMNGQLSWRQLPNGFEVAAKRIDLETETQRMLKTQNLLLRHQAASGKSLEQGEFKAENLDLSAGLRLVSYLPLTDKLRAQLNDYAPRGQLKKIALKWEGALDAPKSYAMQSDFVDLGLNTVGAWPGFDRLSGSIEANQDRGKIQLASKAVHVDFPNVFRHALKFDQLNAAADWRIKNRQLNLSLSKLSFANSHGAGSVNGSLAVPAQGNIYADLNGRLEHGNAPHAYLYIPRVISERTYDWTRQALVKGKVEDLRFTLKGEVVHFPFADDRHGQFRLSLKAKEGVLRYAERWPQIDGLDATINFSGKRMEITSSQGTISGARIVRTKVVMPDVIIPEETLEIEGEVQAPTQHFLGFIDNSPVGEYIDHFTDGMKAEGNGRLLLSMNMPLHHLDKTKVNGDFQFLGNRVNLGPEWPVLDQAGGKIQFTEKGVTVPRVAARALGGPIALSVNTAADGLIRLTLSGRSTATALEQFYPGAITTRLKGNLDWVASAAIRDQAVNLVWTSNLAGLESTLPYPLGKSALENIPLKLERRVIDARHDVWAIHYGKLISAQLQRATQGDSKVFEKGAIQLGGATATMPAQHGVRVDGELERLDADQWRSLAPEGAAQDKLPVSGINLKIKSFDFLGRRFANMNINAWSQRDSWQAKLQSDELEGEFNWRERDGGKLVARFKHLAFPEPLPKRDKPAGKERDLDLPGLDVVIEQTRLQQLSLGKLELLANKQGSDWKIERLRISNPDAVFHGEGLWQNWLAQPQTKLNVDLDVKDVGKFLARMGHADRIKSGTAKMNGTLTWRGSPQDFNLASLNGDLKMDAQRGQFLKVSPGVGKLLGLLSLQSLPRRLTLDFRDVFSEGFAFDNIVGVMSVNQGVMSTKDFVMQGPSAVVTMTGTTDLDKETQNLRVKVVPGVGDSVSLLAFLGGPAVGIGTFIVQKLLKDPLGQIVAYDYAVTGTWDNPVVTKLNTKASEFSQ